MKIVLFLACGAALAASSDFRAGAARRDITPKEPVPMWGYGARHDALSSGVLDPLYVEAVVIEAGGEKLAIVGLDLGRAPAERSLIHIRKRISDGAHIRYSFIAGSHTHHGPVLELSDEPGKGKGKFDAALRYYQQMEDGITAAVLEADRNLAPARLASGSVQLTGFNRNRHTKIEPKPSDRDLALLRLEDAAGKTIAVIVNSTAHPTSIPAENLKFSADYVGAMKREISNATGAVTVFMQGAAGDQSADRGNRDYQVFGAALGREALKLLGDLKAEEPVKPSLAVREERIRFGSRTDFKNPAVTAAYSTAFFPELIPNFIDEYADGVRPRLTVALLNGNIALVGVSGEFFSNHSIRLKERVRGVKQVFFFGYANGYHQYFPTIEAVAEGGYGADAGVSPVEIGAGEQIMNTALVWLYQMLGKMK